MSQRKPSTFFTVCAAILWLAALAVGGSVLMKYGNDAGSSGNPLPSWPADSRIQRSEGLPTLVMLVHPQCPCTRATVAEFELLMAHAQGKVTAHVLFAKPHGAPDGWEHGALWDIVVRIPGVRAESDEDGIEARRFGVETSGQAMLFDATGHLVFSGGITAARGHAGANAGSAALAALIAGDRTPTTQTRVFGCSLF